MAADIVGEFGDTAVAPIRLEMHRLGDDGVEIAAQAFGELGRAQIAVCGEFAGVVVALWPECRDTGPCRRTLRNRALTRRGAEFVEPSRPLAGEKFEQQYTERVDVARSGDRLPHDLLGARVLGRQ